MSKAEEVLKVKRFGHLVAYDLDNKGRVRCNCDCGKRATYTVNQLLKGLINCCGHTFGGISRKNAIDIKFFGKLEVLKDKSSAKNKVVCKCVCGKEQEIAYRDLFLKVKDSCSDCRDNRTQAMKDLDEWVNREFRKDMLVAIEIDKEKTTRMKAFCKFRCDCGNIKSYTKKGLLTLSYGSCGCYKPKVFSPSPSSQKAFKEGKFGKWVVQDYYLEDSRYLLCICECGTEREVRSDSLLNGDTLSCGCLQPELISKKLKGRIKEDAVTRNPLYSVYKSMLGRCYNHSHKDYQNYGGRGITVCNRWVSESRDVTGFKNFLSDMGTTYLKGLEIERLDVNKGYSPDNCTWVCRRSQVNNLRRSRHLKGFGIELTVSEWGYFLGFNPKLLADRINHLKKEWTLEDILTKTFKDRRHHLLYKGEICTATDIFIKEGYTISQRNRLLNTYGDSVSALENVGVNFQVIKPREKVYKGFEQALSDLRVKDKDHFEDHLLYKIERQLKGEMYGF